MDKLEQDKAAIVQCAYEFSQSCFDNWDDDQEMEKNAQNVEESIGECAYHDGLEYQLEDAGLPADEYMSRYEYDQISEWFNEGIDRFIREKFPNA